MKEAFVGFDSAWAGKKNGAICYAVFAGETPVKMGLPQLADFFDAARIINKLQKECDDVLVAIDQPIIVPNASCTRPVDSVAKSFMGQLGSAAQHANRSESRIKASMFGDEAPIWKFIGKIGPSEFLGRTTGPDENRAFVDFEAAKAATGQTRMIEVYPAMALPALESGFMELRRKKRRYAARYDPSRDNFSPDDWGLVCGTVKNYSAKFHLQSLSKWASVMVKPWDSPRKPEKRHQDKIDAALCLIIALMWRRQSNEVWAIGNLDKGYIVTPTSGETRSILRDAANKNEVDISPKQ